MNKLVLFILLFSSNVLAYDACKTSSVHCNKGQIKFVQDQLEYSFRENNEYIFMELLRQNLLTLYHNYQKQLKSVIHCYKEFPQSDICKQRSIETSNNIRKSNTDIRISLALWNPRGKSNEWNDRDIDKFRKNIEHLTYVSDTKIDPLSDEEIIWRDSNGNEFVTTEIDLARQFYDEKKKKHFEANKIKDKPNSVPEIWAKERAINEIKMGSSESYKATYLHDILKNPVLKYIQSSNPTDDEIKIALERLLAEVARNEETVRKMKFSELDQFFFFDELINKILKENPFFCVVAEAKRDAIKRSRKLTENFLAFGGLILCAPFVGTGCVGVMPALFAGNLGNALISKDRLDTTMEFGLFSEIISENEIMGQASDHGISLAMVGMSAPISTLGKVSASVIGSTRLARNLSNYKRGLITAKRVVVKKGSSSSLEGSYKLGFKELRGKDFLIEGIDILTQAPIAIASKVVTKKAYTFKPFEFSLKQLEKNVLKEGVTFATPTTFTANLADMGVALLGMMKLSEKLGIISNKKEKLEQSFMAYEDDLRFDRLRAYEIRCRATIRCYEDLDKLMTFKKDVLMKGNKDFESWHEKHKDKSIKEKIEFLKNNKNFNAYGPYLFPNLYQHFPLGLKTDFEDTDKLKLAKVFHFDVLRLELARELKETSAQDLKKFNNLSDNFKSLILTLPASREVISSDASENEKKKELGRMINFWVEANQEHIISQ